MQRRRGLHPSSEELQRRGRLHGRFLQRGERLSIDGGRLALGAPAGDLQVVFFFNETCPYCLRSAPTVVDVATTLQREFGAERLLKVIDDSRHRSAREVVDAIYAAVEEFRGDAAPNDDMTAVAVKIHSLPGAER